MVDTSRVPELDKLFEGVGSTEKVRTKELPDFILHGYLEVNDENPSISIDAALKSVGIIEGIMDGKRSLSKELVGKE